MPVATIDPEKYERFELKTAPADPTVPGDEDGYVMLRPLPYGMKLTRRDKATKMMMRARNERGQKSQDADVEIETLSEWATQFDFAYCVGTHNLTDRNGRVLDFTKPMDFKMLDPRVGTEIEKLIQALNEDESEESLEDFLKRSGSSSEDEENTSPTVLSTT